MKLVLLVMTSCCATIQSATLQSNDELRERAAAQLERLTPFREMGNPEQIRARSDPVADDLREETDRRTGGSREDEDTSLDLLYDLEAEGDSTHGRIKRTGGGILSILGKVASASAGASSGIVSGLSSGLSGASSSGKGYAAHSEEYGPPVHHYDDKSFDVWAFKRAILNTLFQALKAIGGGVIALKGQLIKGGGYLISTKGKIVSAKGEAITSLGRHIASSAVLSPASLEHHHHQGGYSYESPHIEATGHEEYEGPPPSAHGYSSSGPYGASSSDDGVQAGLLFLKPIESEHKHHEDLDPRHPNVADFEDGFASSHQKGQSGHHHGNDLSEHKVEPASSYGPPPPPPSSHGEENGKIIGPTSFSSDTSLLHPQPIVHQSHSSVQQLADPHSIAFQQLQSIIDHGHKVQSTSLDLPDAQSVQSNYPQGTANLSFGTVRIEPMKIPVLSEPSMFYGQNHGPLQPSSFGGYGVGLRRKDSIVNLQSIEILPAIGLDFIRNTRNHRTQTA